MTKDVPHALYYEALFAHIEKCDDCSWVTGTLCSTAKKLLDASAQRAAQIMAPIPVVLPRGKAKA